MIQDTNGNELTLDDININDIVYCRKDLLLSEVVLIKGIKNAKTLCLNYLKNHEKIDEYSYIPLTSIKTIILIKKKKSKISFKDRIKDWRKRVIEK